ncbi:MAG: preprotein translocase subunit SecG [Acidobacteriota bacterium]|jgi:preprotein translocase subunit SecG|nr:preprotein translocase subunit SecG [Acidobacteriota bacterium]
MLYYAVVALHVIVCIILVLVVLLQSGKGADLAGAFGGGATQTAFGSRGPASFLSRMTTVAAVIFMVTSVGLSMMTERRAADDSSILDTGKATVQEEKKQEGADGKSDNAAPSPAQIEEQMRQIQEKQQSAPATTPTPDNAAPDAAAPAEGNR